jgi:hypothetical protein
MDETSTNAEISDAILKLMKLAQTALDAGRIDEASRLLRLAASAAENNVLMQKIRATAPDTALVSLAGEIPSKPE